MTKEVKVWYQSKTIWANILLIIAAISTDVATSLQTGGAVTFAAVINIALRAITKSPIKFN